MSSFDLMQLQITFMFPWIREFYRKVNCHQTVENTNVYSVISAMFPLMSLCHGHILGYTTMQDVKRLEVSKKLCFKKNSLSNSSNYYFYMNTGLVYGGRESSARCAAKKTPANRQTCCKQTQHNTLLYSQKVKFVVYCDANYNIVCLMLLMSYFAVSGLLSCAPLSSCYFMATLGKIKCLLSFFQDFLQHQRDFCTSVLDLLPDLCLGHLVCLEDMHEEETIKLYCSVS